MWLGTLTQQISIPNPTHEPVWKYYQHRIQTQVLHLALTLWKLMLSSKGNTELRQVDLNHVRVFRQTVKRIKAIFSFTVSAAALAMQTQ